MSVAYSPNGERIASASGDKTVRLWDATSGKLIRTIEGHQDKLTCVAFNHDGSRIASGSRSVRIWDAVSGEEVAVIKGAGDWIGAVAFSPDGSRIVSSSGIESNIIQVWDAESAEPIASWRTDRWRTDRGWGSVVFSADGRKVIGPDGKSICVWDAVTGAKLAEFTGHDSPIAVFADGTRIVSGGESVRVWDFATGESLLVLRGHGYHVTAVTVSPDGRRIVSGAVDGSVRIWDTPPDHEP